MESVSGNVVKGGIGSKTGNTSTGQSVHGAGTKQPQTVLQK